MVMETKRVNNVERKKTFLCCGCDRICTNKCIMQVNKNRMTEPTEFLPGVYVGDQLAAKNPDFFRQNNIVRVVNCTSTLPFHFKGVEYFRVPVDDYPDEINNNIMAAYLIPAIKFIVKE